MTVARLKWIEETLVHALMATSPHVKMHLVQMSIEKVT